MKTYLVYMKDRGHEVCVEIQAENARAARALAYEYHPMGVVLRVEMEGS